MKILMAIVTTITLYACTQAEAHCNIDERPYKLQVALKDLEIFVRTIDHDITLWVHNPKSDAFEKIDYNRQIQEIYPELKKTLTGLCTTNQRKQLDKLFDSISQLISKKTISLQRL